MIYNDLIKELVSKKKAFDLDIHGKNDVLLAEMAASDYRAFKQIPARLLSPGLIDSGSLSLCSMWGEEASFSPGDYEATALSLIPKGVNLHSFHPCLLTKKIIDASLVAQLWDTFSKKGNLGPKATEWFDANVINDAVARRLDIISLLDPAEVKLLRDDSLIAGLHNRAMNGHFLEQIGRRDIIVKEILNGWWINDGQHNSPTDDIIYGRLRPSSVAEAISKRMEMTPGENDALFYDCYVAGFPPQTVAPLINSRARQDWVMTVFPSSDLINTFKHHARMKGRILEVELGM